MSHRKIYSYDDVCTLLKEHAEIIDIKFEKLNENKNITNPTEQEYKKLLQTLLEKATNVVQCIGIYLRGKNKDQRCQAPPHSGSNYCLKHRSQDPKNKQFYETDPKLLEEAIEMIKKNKLDKQ